MGRMGLSPQRVLEAGAELADEIGFEQVTISEVARRFGVKVASLYSHIGGAEDLRSGIALLALAELADRCSVALAGRAGPDALAAFGNVHRDYAAQHPGRFDAMRHRLSAEAAAGSAGPRLAEMMRAVLRGYNLAEPDQTHAVRLLGSTIHGYITLELAGSFSHSRPGSQESWERVLTALDALLQTWPTA